MEMGTPPIAAFPTISFNLNPNGFCKLAMSLDKIIQGLDSSNKAVRLKALKLMLRYPDATPLQLVKCLCSSDNRNFEFLEVFELGAAMRESWRRLEGVDDEEEVYQLLQEYFERSPQEHKHVVMHILDLIRTERAGAMSRELKHK